MIKFRTLFAADKNHAPLKNKRRKIDTVAHDDGNPEVYQMRVAMIKPTTFEPKCVKGKCFDFLWV